MIIYLSMIAIIILCAIINRIACPKFKSIHLDLRPAKLWAYLPMVYIIFWTGIRTQFVDTAAYIRTYEEIPVDSLQSIIDFSFGYDRDWLFYFVSGVFKMFFGDNYHWWLFAIALICGLCIMRQLYRHSDDVFFSLYLFMTMNIFTWMMNGIRQFIAVAILFAFSDWMTDKRKRAQYILLVLFMSMVHSSALYALPFFIIIMYAKPWDWKMIFLIVAVAVAIANANQFVDVLAETVAQDYAVTLGESMGSSLIRAAVAFVPVFISLLGKRIIRWQNDMYLNLCVNMSLVCALLYTLSSFTDGILIGRMPMYFQVYNLILLPWLLKHCFSRRDSTTLSVICVCCYFIFFIYQATIAGNYYYNSDITGFLGNDLW